LGKKESPQLKRDFKQRQREKGFLLAINATGGVIGGRKNQRRPREKRVKEKTSPPEKGGLYPLPL